MNMDSETYKKFTKARAPKSPLGKDCFHAFWVGGLICTFAEGLLHIYQMLNISEEDAKTLERCHNLALSAPAPTLDVG